MTHRVRLSPLAIEDLVVLYRWMMAEADGGIADAYLDRPEGRIAALATYPDRGTPRDDLHPGVRTLSFERRLLIVYLVAGDAADVLRIVDARRDLAPLLG